jgi:multiple sugar transport system permease protein
MFPTQISSRNKLGRAIYLCLVFGILILWLLPLIAVMLTSIRSFEDINAGNYWGVPSKIHFMQNYSEVFLRTPMLRYLLNSLIVTLPAVFFAMLFSAMAGFTLAIHRFRGQLFIFAAFIAGNFIPFQILLIPVRTLTLNLGIYDTWWGLMLFHIAFQSGFCVFFLRNFIVELPFSLVESARVEGASEWRIFWQVIIPLLRPALGSLAVLVFTFVWNDFFWALTLVQSDTARPVTVGLRELSGQWRASWNLISAGSVVAALPPVIMFFIMQKQFIRGLTFGAVKG